MVPRLLAVNRRNLANDALTAARKCLDAGNLGGAKKQFNAAVRYYIDSNRLFASAEQVYTGSDAQTFPNQLYINPDECIDCGACEPACPWEAIFEEEGVPEVFAEDTPLNYKMMEHTDDFEVCAHEDKPNPSPEEIAANKEKWGYSG